MLLTMCFGVANGPKVEEDRAREGTVATGDSRGVGLKSCAHEARNMQGLRRVGARRADRTMAAMLLLRVGRATDHTATQHSVRRGAVVSVVCDPLRFAVC